MDSTNNDNNISSSAGEKIEVLDVGNPGEEVVVNEGNICQFPNYELHLSSVKEEDKNYISLLDVSKEYLNGETTLIALNKACLTIDRGELVVVLGTSGAGKSTALNIIGGMDTASSGTVLVDKEEITKLSLDELTFYRRKEIGFVFQFYNLIQNLTTLDNIKLATEIVENPLDPVELLKLVGLEDRADNYPSQLSGGEQQRASIARAIAKNPKILLCDEPTGALDYKTGKQILKLLQNINRQNNITTIIITHNNAIALMADKVIKFKSGFVIDIQINEHPKNVEEIEW